MTIAVFPVLSNLWCQWWRGPVTPTFPSCQILVSMLFPFTFFPLQLNKVNQVCLGILILAASIFLVQLCAGTADSCFFFQSPLAYYKMHRVLFFWSPIGRVVLDNLDCGADMTSVTLHYYAVNERCHGDVLSVGGLRRPCTHGISTVFQGEYCWALFNMRLRISCLKKKKKYCLD